MRLKIYQSDKGDCMLLEDAKGQHRVLCDGGMQTSMKEWVRHDLGKYRDANKEIDFVYISHIDSDHISGVLQLLMDEMEWRIEKIQTDNGTPPKKKLDPAKTPRPPQINGILHNSFRLQLGNDTQEIEELLATAAPSLLATTDPALVALGEKARDIASSIPEAVKVTRFSTDVLDIPINDPKRTKKPGKLLLAGAGTDEFKVGTLKFTLIGPTKASLEKLQDDWKRWLRDEKDSVTKLRAELKKRIEVFSNTTTSGTPFDLGFAFSKYKNVTIPNVASLMYLVEEKVGNATKTLLLTGDGHPDQILEGLERIGRLKKKGGIHLDVLKVQHHGSSHNVSDEFVRRVSADHYIIQANGDSGNPDDESLERLFDSRFGTNKDRKAIAAPANQSVHWWFSTTSKHVPVGARRDRFAVVEKLVKGYVKKANKRLKARFNAGTFDELDPSKPPA
jgi:beta-lactamase superfamily II metal-dependent hydrolase